MLFRSPQYVDLVRIQATYGPRGLVVLGVPCNDFAAQEPQEEAEIARYCASTYGVDFPLTSKEKVIGYDAHPLYKWIAQELGSDGLPAWNFHKYLIGRDGLVARQFSPMLSPLAPDVTRAIEAVL